MQSPKAMVTSRPERLLRTTSQSVVLPQPGCVDVDGPQSYQRPQGSTATGSHDHVGIQETCSCQDHANLSGLCYYPWP